MHTRAQRTQAVPSRQATSTCTVTLLRVKHRGCVRTHGAALEWCQWCFVPAEQTRCHSAHGVTCCNTTKSDGSVKLKLRLDAQKVHQVPEGAGDGACQLIVVQVQVPADDDNTVTPLPAITSSYGLASKHSAHTGKQCHHARQRLHAPCSSTVVVCGHTAPPLSGARGALCYRADQVPFGTWRDCLLQQHQVGCAASTSSSITGLTHPRFTKFPRVLGMVPVSWLLLRYRYLPTTTTQLRHRHDRIISWTRRQAQCTPQPSAHKHCHHARKRLHAPCSSTTVVCGHTAPSSSAASGVFVPAEHGVTTSACCDNTKSDVQL